jgi:DNA-binding NtrC family response regulator
MIGLGDLPDTVRLGAGPTIQLTSVTSEGVQEVIFPEVWLDGPLRDAREKLVDHFERAYLTSQLEATSGRIDETARRAGITTRALFDKMQRHGLRKEDFKKKKAPDSSGA